MKKAFLAISLCVSVLFISGCGGEQVEQNVTSKVDDTTITTAATSSVTDITETVVTTDRQDVTATQSSQSATKTTVSNSSAKTTTTTTTVKKESTTTTKNKTTTSSKSVLRILNIGNSFGHNSTSYLADVAAANGKTIEVVNLHKDGCSLKTHWAGYENDQAQYTYELNGTFFSGSLVALKSVLDSEEWDIIVTHPSPSEAAGKTYPMYLKNLITAVKKHCPKAKFYMMQTWALGDDYAHLTNETGLSRAEMWSKVEANSKLASTTTRLPLIPCGAAAYELENWFEQNKPALSFYQGDDCHAADTWGWYLLSLVWYQTLIGEVPNDTFTDFDSVYTNDPVVRAKVHEIAKAAVAAYKK